MSRIHLAAIAATVVCAFMFTGVAQAQEAVPLTQKVALTGTKGFKGTYTIEKFVSQGGKLFAVGKVVGKATGGKRVTKENVKLPAAVSSGAAQASQLPPIPGACQVLNLVLGPINLNLLGLSVRTNQINLRIDAVPGAGNLLGNLLCGITGILDPNALANTPLGQLAQILNALLALSPRT
ncbi:hypothetical protein OJ997_19245 [Solirubrobacter phytolaccae]|uniref:ABC transporter substrate-binding protein n=1 Tax=Solirubrobacter phytolaccae TaxID=1404360 RepID=A0A9X3N9U9_9ACTN|nr:hypothetical protein [Solirubrobacter phytolaccae]MDA0182453.1 hypothetical protein [Solirubrobacter phytolaccae]